MQKYVRLDGNNKAETTISLESCNSDFVWSTEVIFCDFMDNYTKTNYSKTITNGYEHPRKKWNLNLWTSEPKISALYIRTFFTTSHGATS